MRYEVILFSLLLTSTAIAAPKDITAVMKESQSARESIAKEKDSAKKIKKLKELESSINATIKDYEKESPTEGGDAEEKVVKFSYRLEHVFDLASGKITKEVCDKTKGLIKKDDEANSPAGAPLSANAEEALKWADLICK